ncbi:hypothetical protein DAEQUDRAFT_655026, partial [Daedalea quercina L-15889]
TLVSIGRIDEAGYTAAFTGGKLVITNKDGRTVGTKLTIMELHRRLGHIAPRAIRELVSGGCIHGVALVPSDEPETCEVCIRAKSTRKPVPIEREGERAEELGEETHSDLWGASRI